MTIQGNTICSLIQSFPVLLILAQKQNRCLETHFVYKPPTPTQSPEYYQALDALFQNLYGHETQPCYYSTKYGTKPCHEYSHSSHGTNYGSHGTNYFSHGTGYGSHGIGYGSHGYGYGGYRAHVPAYGSYGHGSHAVHYAPSYKKGNLYSGNITYGHGYASAQSYTNNKYKVVVKKTRISKRKKKSQKLRTVGDPCTSVNKGQGMCIVLNACPVLKQMFNKRANDIKTTYILRKSHCGWLNGEPKVCCPIEADIIPPTTPKVLTTTSTLPPTTTTLPSTTTTLPVITTTRKPGPTPNYDALALVGEICTTVYNTRGSCMDIYMCPTFNALLQQARAIPAVVTLLQKAACGFRGQIPQVCCPLSLQNTDEMTTTAPVISTSTSSEKPQSDGDFVTALPEPPVCGLSNVSLDRVVGGVPAKLGAFPWMALLGYRDLSIAQGKRWNCGGALVSKRHVLTAAHCIHKHEDELFLVRLGELDLARDNEGATPIDVPIKTMYKHELYTGNNPVFNDIGVLVLQRDIEFTDLIKPICLFGASSNEWRSATFENYTPFVAGWGDTQYRGIKATHLQVAQVPVLENGECEEAFSSHYESTSRALFSQQALCAGYPGGKIDTCTGDSGGPLIQPLELEGRTPRTYMYAIGVVSLGIHCAEAGRPGLYSRVSYYMPWIEQKILGRTI